MEEDLAVLRDKAFEGWMANKAEGRTSRKGREANKESGGVTSSGSGSGEESSWSKEASKLVKEIRKDLTEAEMK